VYAELAQDVLHMGADCVRRQEQVLRDGGAGHTGDHALQDFALSSGEEIQELGFFEELKRAAKDVEEARSRIENVEELVTALVTFEEKTFF